MRFWSLVVRLYPSGMFPLWMRLVMLARLALTEATVWYCPEWWWQLLQLSTKNCCA
jgi:hypothetical protein